MFNGKGELNASNLTDALKQIAKYAAAMEAVGQDAQVSSITEAQRDQLVERALQSQDGKIALAQAMANPIRKNLDYRGIFRRALVIDPLPQGALAIYDRDIDVQACVISSNGGGPESRVYGDRIQVPEYEIYSNPTVRISEVKRRRFNVIDRAVQKAHQEIQAQEDANGFAAFDFASSIENTVQDIADAGLQKRDLLAIKQQIDGWDLITSKYFMNIKEYTDILAWGSGGGQGVGGGELDPVTMREVLQTGLYAHLWGAEILVSKIVPAGTVFGAADPEFVGIIPIRQDVEVLPADEPKLLKLGWVVSLIEGCSIVNPRGVACGRKSTTVNA